MSSTRNVPGVYRQEIVLSPGPELMTGTAGFVGFADLADEETTGPPIIALRRWDEFAARVKSAPGSYLADAVAGYFQNGGRRCYVACAGLNPADSDALLKALKSLAPVTDIDLVAIPDAMTFYSPGAANQGVALDPLQFALLQHCEHNPGRMAILDAWPAETEAVIEQRQRITAGIGEPVNGALYYPWIKIDDDRLVPPCGHVAGIYARSDGRAGVFKAPANEEILGALDLGILANKAGSGKGTQVPIVPDQEALNPQGVNCLRAFPGRGIRVWGARTLSRDSDWRYINVRRLFLTLQRWIDLKMNWVSFEPNTPVLWIRITREIDAYLMELWNAGALAGETAEQAFFLKCDGETNPPEAREAGQVITEIGLAPARPAEFIVVRIIQHTGVAPQ